MDIIKLLQKRANQGDVRAVCRLAFYHVTGHYVEKDKKRAFELYEKAAEKGYSPAMANLGYMYQNGIGVEKNNEKAVEWYEKGAKKGEAHCLNSLGYMCQFGLGIEKDEKRAFKLYEKAAEKGEANGIYNLACMYNKGIGVEQDEKKAIELLRKAAKKGNAIAMLNLGYMYQEGLGGEKDYTKAKEWYEKAIKKGNAPAMSNLGTLYLLGLGIQQDYNTAEKWFCKSFNNGCLTAKYYVDTFNKIKNRKIKMVNSITEYIEEDIEGVFIRPNINFMSTSHTLYDIDTYRKLKNAAEEFLEDIPLVKDDKSNEFEVLEAICQKIAKQIVYDFDVADDNNEEAKNNKWYTSRNLIGALLEGKCVCAGYAELLRNLCECRGIECIFMSSEIHAFNQVKIGENWYYFDLTNSCDEIKKGRSLQEFLLSEKTFINSCKDNIPSPNQFKYPALYNYNVIKRNE